MNKKIAIITGATSGIGLALAAYLAKKDYELLLIARNKEKLEAIKIKLGANHMLAPLDVADHQQVKHAVDQFAQKHAHIDLLINNAGIAIRGTSELAPEAFLTMLQTNLVGVFNLVHTVTPYMKQQGSGRIINIASRAGKKARAPLGGYAASKFGVIGLNEALYKELAPLGIHVTAICPGWVNTPMTADTTTPKEDMMSVDDIVSTVDYLLHLSPNVSVKEMLLECHRLVGK
ncbi:MAG TPA: SDR family oxidoreductase [Gammaproteobacteria bacterium]|nr:SDR family oxidoreductase [Gammaproteobacteria bacterium]